MRWSWPRPQPTLRVDAAETIGNRLRVAFGARHQTLFSADPPRQRPRMCGIEQRASRGREIVARARVGRCHPSAPIEVGWNVERQRVAGAVGDFPIGEIENRDGPAVHGPSTSGAFSRESAGSRESVSDHYIPITPWTPL